MIMLLSREMAVALLRNTVRLSAAAAQRGLSSRAVPMTTARILGTVPLEGHERRMPQLQNARCYSTDEQEHEQRTGEGDDLNIADILHGVLHKSLFLIDIREPEEIKATGKIGKAINIPMSEIEEAFNMSYADFEAKYHVTKPSVMSQRVVIYCEKGHRDKLVVEKLQKLGYDKVKRYPGGMKEWNYVILGDVDSLPDPDTKGDHIPGLASH